MPAPARCLIDRTQACHACVAASPKECPYAFLLADQETLDRRSAPAPTPRVGTSRRV